MAEGSRVLGLVTAQRRLAHAGCTWSDGVCISVYIVSRALR